MRNDVLRNWKHLRAELSFQWAQFTEHDLDHVDGRRHKLVRLLENHLGFTRTRAEREVDLLVANFENRLRRAS